MINKKQILIFLICLILTTVFILSLRTIAFASSVRDGIDLYAEGEKLYDQSDFQGATRKWKQALRIFEGHNFKKGISQTLSMLGFVCFRAGQYEKALSYREKELAINRQIGDRRWEGNATRSIGDVYSNLGQHEQALTYFEKALAIYKELGDKKWEGHALANIGHEHTKLGHYQKAFSYYEKALALYRQNGNRKEEGFVLGQSCNLSLCLGKEEKALSYYGKALDIYREIDDKAGEGEILRLGFFMYVRLALYEEAIAYRKEASAIHREIGDREEEANDFNDIGSVYSAILGRYDDAIDNFKRALAIHKEIGDKKGEGNDFRYIGGVFFDIGLYEKAFTYYEEALAIHRGIGDKEGEGDDLRWFGSSYALLGWYEKAIGCHEKALAIHRKIGAKEGITSDLGFMGLIYLDLGLSKKAIGSHEKALTIYKEIGAKFNEIQEFKAIRDIHLNLGWYEKALSYHEKIKLKYASFMGVPFDENEDTGIGDMYLEIGQINKAAKIYKQVGDKFRLGRLYLAKKEFVKSLEYFEALLNEELKRRTPSATFRALVGLGLSYEGIKKYRKAKKHYVEAIEIVEEIRNSLTPARRSNFFAGKMLGGFSRLEPYEGLIRVLNIMEQQDSALHYAEYTKARLFAESIASKHQSLTFHLPAKLAAEEKSVANQIAALYKKRENAYLENRMHAYENIDKLLKAKKQEQKIIISKIRKDYPEYASIKYTQPIKVLDIPLKANEYLIEFEVTGTATFAWLVHEGRVIKSYTIPTCRKELTGLVKKYRAYFQVSRKSDLAQFDPKTGHKLYTLLVKDILSLVPKDSHIIIVPDEILGVLPFEALVSQMPKRYQIAEGDKGPFPIGIRYVGDERNISYYQSATALAMIRNIRQKTEATKPMLVVADPVFDVADARVQGKTFLAKVTKYQMNLMRAVKDEGGFSFPRLEQTSVLARNLNKNFNNRVDVLEGLNASYAKLKKYNIENYKYLVFATHAILDNQVPGIREPALVLTQLGNPEDEDGFLTMSEVMDLRLNATCSALTACETGLGKNISGEGVMGMGRAFQYAGAKSVLVSLWSVAEESTTKLTERFFYYLKIGKKSQEALKLARTDIRREGYEHPFYWAPFILIGE